MVGVKSEDRRRHGEGDAEGEDEEQSEVGAGAEYGLACNYTRIRRSSGTWAEHQHQRLPEGGEEGDGERERDTERSMRRVELVGRPRMPEPTGFGMTHCQMTKTRAHTTTDITSAANETPLYVPVIDEVIRRLTTSSSWRRRCPTRGRRSMQRRSELWRYSGRKW